MHSMENDYTPISDESGIGVKMVLFVSAAAFGMVLSYKHYIQCKLNIMLIKKLNVARKEGYCDNICQELIECSSGVSNNKCIITAINCCRYRIHNRFL